MSTRANIILKEGSQELFFYRHSDGYPEGTLPYLQKFADWIKAGNIRNDLGQSAGWLIVLGAIEYNTLPKFQTVSERRFGRVLHETIDSTVEPPEDWKVGSFEPTTGIHGDIEWLYTVDIETGEITYKEV